MSKSAPKFTANYEAFAGVKGFAGHRRRIRTETLALICRSLSTLLSSGVGIKKALKVAAKKTGNARCEEAMRGLYEAVARGDELTTGLKEQGNAFPPLMIDMVHVAEQTGALPEVLRSLSQHYENLVRQRKSFLRQIFWPMLQLGMAILIIAFLIFILGWVAETMGGSSIEILPGLSGTRGAIVWLMINFSVFFGLYLAYQWSRHSLVGQKFLDAYLLKVPLLGRCLQSFAIARFSWAFALTQRAGMSIQPSLESSLKATSNGAFIATYPQVWGLLQAGESFGDSLAATGLFTEEYLQMVHSAEHSGTVPEMLDHLSPQFEEEARLSLQTLSTGLAWSIWVCIAMLIVYMIFRIFTMVYLNPINDLLQEI